MAGLSLQITQPGLDGPVAVPIESVRQTVECTGSGNDAAVCLLTAVRVQIPYELAATSTAVLKDGIVAPVAAITVLEEDRPSRSFQIQPISVNGHVITSCDPTWDTTLEAVCTRTAYHANGSPVNADGPAARGETISIFAYGLGQTSPPAVTGAPASVSASLDPPQSVRINFEALSNAPSWLPRHDDPAPYNLPPVTPRFAGLSAGQVGVYQIDITIPMDVKVELRCTSDYGPNLVIMVTTPPGTETVPVCVGS